MPNKDHYINVGPLGTFKKSGDYWSVPRDVDAIIQKIRSGETDKVVLHFHGGLVNEKDGMDTAKRMAEVYTEAGCYPISFVWETGFLETVRRNLLSIHETKLAKKLIKLVTRYAMKRLGLDGRGGGGRRTDTEYEQQMQLDPPFSGWDAEIQQALNTPQESARSLAHADTAVRDLRIAEATLQREIARELQADREWKEIWHDEVPNTSLVDREVASFAARESASRSVSWMAVAKWFAQITVAVIRRFMMKTDHGLHSTVVEEVLRKIYIADAGEWVWGRMKDVAAQMFLPNEGLDGEELHPGSYFLEKLKPVLQEKPDLKVHLVGHSAGSIAICELLRAAERMNASLPVGWIVFMAPACLSEMFHQDIVTREDRYDDFRMFTMRDDFELKDDLVDDLPWFYPSSLLYFISGVLEGTDDMPLAGMHRYQSGDDPYDLDMLIEIRDFLATDDRLVLTPTSTTNPDAGPGMKSNAIDHGKFDNDDDGRESLIQILST